MYFKALVGYIRDYSVDTDNKISNTDPRPLLIVKLDNVRKAGLVTNTTISYFLRRYLAFGLACTNAVIERESEQNNVTEFSPDFILSNPIVITTNTSASMGDIQSKRLVMSKKQSWLIRPLPTAEELWIMFILFLHDH